jgi:hypothetical protein
MPPKKRDGVSGYYVELPDDLLEEWRAFVDSFPLGTQAQHTAMAFRRHMDHPPTPKVTALPAVDMTGPAKPKRKGRK